MKSNLKKEFEDICNQYLIAFQNRQEYDDNSYDWVEFGKIVFINDMYLNFDDIRYDVDNNIKPGEIDIWYWTSVDRAEMGIKYLTYEEFCEGVPDPISEEKLEEIQELRNKLEKIKSEFLESISDYIDPDIKPLF